MRNIFAIFFAAILLYSSTIFAADNIITIEENPYSSVLVGSVLYVISESGNRMYRINMTNNKFISSIKLDNGPTMGITYNGKIYIANSEDRTVSVYYSTGAYKTLSVVGVGPLGMVPIGSRIYVASFDDKVTVVDSIGDSRLDDVILREGGTPTKYMTVTGNRIFLHHPATNSVSVFTTSGNKILKNFPVGKSPQSSVLIGKSLYVINRDSNDVTVVNTDTYDTITTIPVGNGPTTGVLAGKKIYINNTLGDSVSIVDTEKNTVTATLPVGKNPVAVLAKDPFVFSINKGNDSLSVIDTKTDTVVHTLMTGKEPLSGTFAGNSLYINNSGEKTLSYFSTIPPILGLMTSTAASGTYRQGDQMEIAANFSQKLAPGSTMDIVLNNGAELTLSTVDGFYLKGSYIIGANQLTSDLTVSTIKSARILALYGVAGTTYTLPIGKNLGDLRNIVIGEGSSVIATGPVCPTKGHYRICPLTKTPINVVEYGTNLLCEKIIADIQAEHTQKRVNRLDVLYMAVNMSRQTTSDTNYWGTFTDVSEPMKPLLAVALNKGIITNTELFEPMKPITRAEAYTLLMKSVCLVPQPTPGQNWTQALHETAYNAGITQKTLSRFKPSSIVTKKEVFMLASQLADWADRTGGCQPVQCTTGQ